MAKRLAQLRMHAAMQRQGAVWAEAGAEACAEAQVREAPDAGGCVVRMQEVLQMAVKPMVPVAAMVRCGFAAEPAAAPGAARQSAAHPRWQQRLVVPGLPAAAARVASLPATVLVRWHAPCPAERELSAGRRHFRVSSLGVLPAAGCPPPLAGPAMMVPTRLPTATTLLDYCYSRSCSSASSLRRKLATAPGCSDRAAMRRLRTMRPTMRWKVPIQPPFEEAPATPSAQQHGHAAAS